MNEPFQMLIELKTGDAETYFAIEDALAQYAWMMTEYRDGVVIPRQVTAILTGGRPFGIIAAQTRRFGFIDGSPGDQGRYPASLVPLISEQWSSMF